MLKNPACPNYFIGKDSDDYQRYRYSVLLVIVAYHYYRYYVLHRLKKLKFLDSTPVSSKERKEAERVGPYSLPAKPDDSLVHIDI